MKISDTDVINNLKKIISVVGVDSFNNHQRANALINDFFTGSENTTTKRLIKALIDADAFKKISNASNGDHDSVCKALKDILVDVESLSEERAEMAIGWVCGALDKRKPNLPKPVQPKPQQAQTSSSGNNGSYGGQSSSNSSYSHTRQPTQQPRTVNTPSNNTYGLNLNHHVKRKKKVPKKLIGFAITLCVLAAFAYFVVWPKMIYPNMANEELYTPEIIQTYSGTYTAGKTVGNAVVTITSCDQSGNLMGFFEFILGNTYGKYEVTGKIDEKKNNGNLVLSLTPGQWAVQPNDYSQLETMTVVITDRYQSFECSQYCMYWSIGCDDEYFIKTVDDFQKLVGSEATYQLKNDIDLSGVNWKPIEEFKGTLFGNGFTIKNMSIETSSSNVGFFSTLSGTIISLNFENANITVSGRNENIGIVCGEMKGSISDITVSGSVVAEKCTNVGGVCGLISSSGEENVELNNITNNANVNGINTVGGCFGKIYYFIDNGIKQYALTLSNLQNNGSVIAKEDFSGGITGYLFAKATGFGGGVNVSVIDCSNNGTVTGRYRVGGIVGLEETSTKPSYIEGCINSGIITAEAIVGCIAGETSVFYIKDCSNEGSTLNATGFFVEEGNKYAYVGGIVGKGACTENCTNYIDISYNGGGDYVGGIMGYCNLHQTILGSTSLVDSADSYVKNLTNLGKISGNSYVGGIIGGIKYHWNNGCAALTCTFEKLINKGNIFGTGEYVSGICGYMSGKVSGLGGSMKWFVYDCINEATVSGTDSVGGIFGSFINGEAGKSGVKGWTVTIDGCSSIGSISGNSHTGDIIGFDQIIR